MLKPLAILAAAALLAGSAYAQCATLSYNGTFNGQKGTIFELQNLSPTTPMIIGSFDQAFYTTDTADIEIYTIAGPCAGLEMVPTAWTLVGTATGVAHVGTTTNPTPMTPLPIAINIAIPPGATQSFYITATNNTASSVYYSSGVNQYGVQYASNSDIALIGRTGMSYPFGSNFGVGTAGRLWNGVVHYCPSGTGTVLAAASSVGTGCVSAQASLYENHGAFDLSNTSLAFTWVGNGYVVLPGTTAIAPQSSAPVTMGDDVVLQFPLGFSMPHAAGATTDVWVSSNGFLNLTTNALNGCCAFNLNQFLTNGPTFAAKWRDLNPATGGTVQFDSDPSNGVAYVTFTGVVDFGTTSPNDFQYVLYQNGSVELRFGNVAPTAGATGYSPGANSVDPGSTDLSALTVAVLGTQDIRPLAMTSTPRPVANIPINLTTSNIAPSTLFGAVLLGLNNPSLDLTAFGMPGCTQYSDGLVTLLFLTGGQTSVVTPFTVPNAVGFTLYAQSVTYDPASGLTPLGAIASNGRRLDIGDY